MLLDTHAFIWLDDERQKLSPAAAQACSDSANALWLSVVSLWEIQIKMQLGKLTLRGSALNFSTSAGRLNQPFVERVRITFSPEVGARAPVQKRIESLAIVPRAAGA